jgi:hypothetical protein
MDWNRIYHSLMNKAMSENRTKQFGEYYELHHIIPDFMFKNRKRFKTLGGHVEGNPNDPSNVVLLTAREHFVAHLLLIRMYEGTEFYTRCVQSLMLMKAGGRKNERISYYRTLTFKGMRSRLYEKHRSELADLVSKKHAGMIVVRDAMTGAMIGSVPNTHPKVVDGTWRHHAVGLKRSDEVKQLRHRQTVGRNNPNASRTPDDVFIKSYCDMCAEVDEVVPPRLWSKVCQRREQPTLKSLHHPFRQEFISRMVSTAEQMLSREYDPSRWHHKNKKGTVLYHETLKRLTK